MFSKVNIKEYNEQLENILENKKIDSEAKNLLLSMLYKIENSYNDYYIVKTNVQTKEKFIEKVLSIIENECQEIIITTPEKEENKEVRNKDYIIDEKKGKIITCANEKDLLYAIFMLDIKYNQYQSDKEYKSKKLKKEESMRYNALQEFLAKGTAMHESEVIRDFSGWSWSSNYKELEDTRINLIYQNILLLVGTKTRDEILTPKSLNNKFIGMQANVEDLRKYNTINKNNEEKKETNTYNDVIKEAFEKIYTADKVENIINYINLIILALEMKSNEEYEKEINLRAKEEKKIVKLMTNKEQFLKTLESNQKKLNSNIEKIDRILKDKQLLQKEFCRRNNLLEDSKKIFSSSQLIKILENEKRQFKNEIDIEKKLFNENEYKEKQEQYNKEIKLYDEIVKASESIEELIINIQLEFLKCFESLIETSKTKLQIVNLMYKFRYYCLIPVNENKRIKDIPELKKKLKDVTNLLIDKCIDKKVIENISNSVSLCYNTLKYIFETQTTNLESLEIRISKTREEVISINEKKEKNIKYYITIDLFDGNEQVESYKEVVNNLKLLKIRLKKKTPLFL